MGALRGVGDGHELAEVRGAGAGDKTLGAIDDVVITLAHCACLHGPGVGTCVRFGLHEAELFLAAQYRVKEACFFAHRSAHKESA